MLTARIRRLRTADPESAGTTLEDPADRPLRRLYLPGVGPSPASVQTVKVLTADAGSLLGDVIEITGDDMGAILEQVPDGWKLLSARRT
ncbi:hypothetical protein [Microbacterium sp. Leaf320]|uniref:hypothetical protein n=1 Tax=Microbacterium sp. Leaf320 TaxID=1736334 RepID=UPI0006FB7989|nr:hypothetical protein [Microbacterium sp. Leaf320]KQQ66944.1 hypothetical protein ASF63_06760 [Microbacterium sp. Leaf320]